MTDKKWVSKAFSKNKGALHRKLGVKQGQRIPEAKLEKAENSGNPKERKEASLAETAKGFNHSKTPRKVLGKY